MTDRPKSFTDPPRRVPNPPFIYGRIDRATNRSHPIKGYLVEARLGRRILDKTSTDGSGRFLLEWGDRNISANGRVVVRVYTPWRTAAGERELVASDLRSPRTVVFKSFAPPSKGGRGGDKRTPRSKPVMIEKFEADGDWPIRVESSCHPVHLTWRVKFREDLSRESVRVELFEGTKIIRRALPLEGSVQVKNEKTSIYTLVAAHNERARNLRDSRSVMVKRFRTLALFFEGNIRPSADIQAGVQITCPAPKGGLKVNLTSSEPDTIRGRELFISPGKRGSLTQLRSGLKQGYAEVTALADGYLSDTVRLLITEKGS